MSFGQNSYFVKGGMLYSHTTQKITYSSGTLFHYYDIEPLISPTIQVGSNIAMKNNFYVPISLSYTQMGFTSWVKTTPHGTRITTQTLGAESGIGWNPYPRLKLETLIGINVPLTDLKRSNYDSTVWDDENFSKNKGKFEIPFFINVDYRFTKKLFLEAGYRASLKPYFTLTEDRVIFYDYFSNGLQLKLGYQFTL